MKERPGMHRKSLIMPGGRSLTVGCLVLSFCFSCFGQAADPISVPGAILGSTAVFSRNSSWIGLGSPLTLTNGQGWHAGAFSERRFGIKELQTWGTAIAFTKLNTTLGVGYARSVYDSRGTQRLGLGTVLRGRSVQAAVQLNGCSVKWSQEIPGKYLIYSSVGLSVKLNPEIVLGCLIRAPENWFGPKNDQVVPQSMLVAELLWRPEDRVDIAFQIAKVEKMGLYWSGSINLHTHSGWQLGVGSSSYNSLYNIQLILPINKLSLLLAMDYHGLLGASPAAYIYGPVGFLNEKNM